MKLFSLLKNAAILLVLTLALSGCKKKGAEPHAGIVQETEPLQPVIQGNALISDLTVVNLYERADGSVEALFSESPRIFVATEIGKINILRKALKQKCMVRASYDPRHAVLNDLELLPGVFSRIDPKLLVPDKGYTVKIDLDNDSQQLDNCVNGQSLKQSEATLTNVIPDLATAQQIFNYLLQQCCVLPGPYQIDQCIPFQYAWDGCHARAHKMCWVINNKFKYDTHKIFSIANDHVGEWLCVQAQKWGGCCIRWWYHVAPLVNVNTPAGVKAYVFDPSMFDQPVLLSTWLHAQENPVCSSGYTANVTKISLQPTSSYKPNDFYGTVFSQDPWYSYTNNSLNNFSTLTTCP